MSEHAVNYGSMEPSERVSNPTPLAPELASGQQQVPLANLSQEFVGQQTLEAPRPAVRRKTQERARMGAREQEARASGAPKELAGKQVAPGFEALPGRLGGGQQAAEPSKSRSCQRPYPMKVAFIVANEFCERFSYYGLRTVLVLYFNSVLGLGESASTISFHLFTTLCYLTPILGAILGDSIWGKYKTILRLSVVYLIGELVLVLASSFWQLSALSAAGTFVGLLLVGLGTGGIKPCVSAFGGDQFHAHETRWRENFFSIFYAAINVGSLISMFVTPMLRSKFQCSNRLDCYPLAFGLLSVIMLLSIVIFVAASRHYTQVALPSENVILAFCRCVSLALRRKWLGRTPSPAQQAPPSSEGAKSAAVLAAKHQQSTQAGQQASSGQLNLALQLEAPDSGSSSSVSLASGPEERLVAAPKARDHLSERFELAAAELAAAELAAAELAAAKLAPAGKGATGELQVSVVEPSRAKQQQQLQSTSTANRDHWLYLASDRFEARSIEEFRCVLGIFLLFLPTPVYWCLFDQQGSLWTLQAARMDGRVPGTNFTLDPDQMMVANPLLLLASIALFQALIYPALNKCNLLTRPIQRMTTGGLLTAASFIASALIELHIQARLPAQAPAAGFGRLVLVNGLADCALLEPSVAYVQIPSEPLVLERAPGGANTSLAPQAHTQPPPVFEQRLASEPLEPLSSLQFDLVAASSTGGGGSASGTSQQPLWHKFPLNNYQFKFKLANGRRASRPAPELSASSGAHAKASNLSQAFTQMCPFDASQTLELSLGVLPDRSSRLLYVEQGNGKLSYKLFNESLALAPPGSARLRLIYEYFGSYAQASSKQFYLVMRETSKQSANKASSSGSKPIEINLVGRDGQVLISDYVNVPVHLAAGVEFELRTRERPAKFSGFIAQNFTSTKNKQLVEMNSAANSPIVLLLKPGTRNLLLVNQRDAQTFDFKQELLQDNDYRVSMLWQLIPYYLISTSEVMFSITGLEFSYSMAPASMKSLMIGAWALTTALGNILTVAVESVQPFANLAHDFLFYAALMVLDMMLFAYLGYRYKPHKIEESDKSRESD